ncbi:deoxyribodipyrimidine photo-lyase [Occallatibacter savannae]|uniref:deoxyribodipyrimidine photo-lyase n=1 Tax=Occallatibacter savannae TaxID=1002691 RepID=UPI000D68AA07|nr:deoxyribodipyrimidine photo-lyase [Occallatibacter savannae]
MSNKPEKDPLAQFAQDPRVLVRRDGPPRPDSRCVVYWMQRAMRIHENPALDFAIDVANHLGLPVVVFFSVIPNYPNANLRHYHFMQQGLRDVELDAAGRGVGFVLRRHPDNSLEKFLEEVQAAILIGDENPCREPERWRQTLSRKLKLPYWTVDADVVVPSVVFGRDWFLLQHMRPHLKQALPKFLVPPRSPKPQHPWQKPKSLESFSLDQDITSGFKSLDRSIGPVDTFTGGTHAALKHLRDFVAHGLNNYDEKRNHPEINGTSRLSPYLHFGNIGPLTIALAVERAHAEGKAPRPACDRFLDQVIAWRELSVLFVKYNPNYDNWECAEPWARQTLVEHAADPRSHRYTFEQLERAETHDDLWNAAQRQMVHHGWMHNYLRMYWAKMILEWAPDPARAYEWAVILNDRYELDGRDPNGYQGIAWAIVGKHDRPWFNRPVFGLIRPMSGASTAKKFDSKAYIEQYGSNASALF